MGEWWTRGGRRGRRRGKDSFDRSRRIAPSNESTGSLESRVSARRRRAGTRERRRERRRRRYRLRRTGHITTSRIAAASPRRRVRANATAARRRRREKKATRYPRGANADEDRRFAAPASDARGRARRFSRDAIAMRRTLSSTRIRMRAACRPGKGAGACARRRFGRAAGRRPRRRPKLSEARSARLEDLSKIQFTSSHLTCRALSPSSRGRRRGSLPRCRAAASRPRPPLPRPPRRRPPRWTAA